MNYKLTLTQEGGTTPYEVGFAFPRGLPHLAPHTVDMNFARAIVAKAQGWEYFNSLIPEDAVGVEIGVYDGDGAARLLERKPKLLYLVDPWAKNADDPWTEDGDKMEQRYQAVCVRFAGKENVNVIRQYSGDFLPTLADKSLDFVFIDGDHSTDAAYKDICESARCLKVGGVMGIDDVVTCPLWAPKIKAAIEKFMTSKDRPAVNLVSAINDPIILRRIA